MGLFISIHQRLFLQGRSGPELSERDAAGILRRVACNALRGWFWRLRLGSCQGRLFVGRRALILSPGHIHCGRDVKFEENSEIQGLSVHGLHFGDRVTVGRGASIRPSSYYGGDLGQGMTVGAGSSIGAYNWIGASGQISIGRDVMLGPYVVIIPENHNFDELEVSIREQGVSQAPVVIEDDCWIGTRATILAGVTVGKGSIVAAGAVVIRDVEPGSVVGGVPARLIRKRGPQP